MDDFSTDEAELEAAARAYLDYTTLLTTSDRTARVSAIGGELESIWSDVLSSFVSGENSAKLLLPKLLSLSTDDFLPTLGEGLIQSWIRSQDESALQWLESEAEGDARLRIALSGVVLGPEDARDFPGLNKWTYRSTGQ